MTDENALEPVCHIPEPERRIVGTRCHHPCLWCKCNAQDPSQMALECTEKLAALHVPQADRFVCGARNEGPAIRRKRDRQNGTLMSFENPDELAAPYVSKMNC